MAVGTCDCANDPCEVDMIDFRATQAFTERIGRGSHWYHAIDTHKKSVITDAALIESLE